MRRLPSEPVYLMNKRIWREAYRIYKRRERIAIIEISVIAVSLIVLFFATSPLIDNFKNRIDGVDCEFQVVDFDNGNSVYFECGKENALIDSGNEKHGEELVDYLIANNIEDIDYLFVSGNNEEYLKSLEKLLNSVTVKSIVMPSTDVVSEQHPFNDFIATTSVVSRHAVKGMSFRIGKSTFDIIDEKSLLMHISFTDNKFLINHTDNELKINNPDYDVIIQKCDYATEVIESESEKSYKTDINGNIIIKSNEVDIKIECENQ